MVVVPSAAAAASMAFSVAPTLGMESTISPPVRAPVQCRALPRSSIPAPRVRMAARCRSMGRAPMRHPPGRLVSARPSLASKGAQNRMEARICPAVCPGKVLLAGGPESTASLPSHRAAQPTPRKSAMQCSTSARRGTAWSRTSPVQSSDAAKSGRTLFFAAGIFTLPFSGRPPVTTIRSSMSVPPFRKRYPTVCKTGPECEADKFVL